MLIFVMLNIVMLNVVMLNVVVLNVVMLNVIMLNVIMLNVIMLNVVMLNVMAPWTGLTYNPLLSKTKENITDRDVTLKLSFLSLKLFFKNGFMTLSRKIFDQLTSGQQKRSYKCPIMIWSVPDIHSYQTFSTQIKLCTCTSLPILIILLSRWAQTFWGQCYKTITL